MTASYLEHVTLTTGHTRRSWREEVSAQALEACADLIARITAGDVSESVRIPGVGEYYLSGRASSRCLAATVTDAHGTPIATIGVAAHSRCGATLWREMHRWGETPVVTDPERVPPEPWVAVALEMAIVDHQDATQWLGDFERCIGWAWINQCMEKIP